MGTERSTEYKGQCICGSGSYRVDDCSPDHGWPTSTPQWYEAKIDCPHCNARYQIEQREKKFVLIESEKLKGQEALLHEARARSKALMATASVQSVLHTLESLLASQKSVAATCRLLEAAGLTHYSEASFRNHWSSPTTWVKENISADKLCRVLTLLNVTPAEILQELSAIQDLEKAAKAPIEPYGKPIYELP